MTENVFDFLQRRGYLDQATYPEELREKLGKESLTFYIGFDATADSLTLGHYLQIKVMQHLQRAGHRPIALLGGGTTMIGDPSGRTDMRQLMNKERIDHNALCFKNQLSKLLDFSEGKAIFENNADWLLNLNFLDFMREIGVHFSVNRMLTLDAYKNRMEEGLTFFEFSYILMQSYDFLYLYRKHHCTLQIGGSDQWSNMLGGYELVRRIEDDRVYSMTFQLLTTADGVKMGKTQSGAIWLNPEKTSPYDMYQYMRNVDDRDVIKFMNLLTDLSDEEIAQYAKLEGADINQAKERLAWEIVKDIHSQEEADKAQNAARALFDQGGVSKDMPTSEISQTELGEGLNLIDLLLKAELVASSSEGRRLIKQGGITVAGEKATSHDQVIGPKDFDDKKTLHVKKGKKNHHLFKLV
ncbi:MAG: tyrosine--tRNA ligase [Tissierellia bacterium]|nr:tyrosine--tRNA ligase [Tissierellia bacterium]